MHVLYIPGLGDSTAVWQQRAVATWRIWGIYPHMFRMNWGDGEPYGPKFERLLAYIDELRKTDTVGIVCSSAGASAALTAFAARQNAINGVVCIAGKIHHPGAIGGSYRSRNPAFVEAAHLVDKALNELKPRYGDILSIRGIFDPIVPARDSYLEGAHNRITITSGHVTTIGYQLVFGAPRFIRFLKAA